jgi:hypothetical protein
MEEITKLDVEKRLFLALQWMGCSVFVMANGTGE